MSRHRSHSLLRLYTRYCLLLAFAQLSLLLVGILIWDGVTDIRHRDAMLRQLHGTHALISQQLLSRPADAQDEALRSLRSQFRYPVSLTTLDGTLALLDGQQQKKLQRGWVVVTDDGRHSYQRLADSDKVVSLGDFESDTVPLQEGSGLELSQMLELVLLLIVTITVPFYFLIHRLWRDVRMLDCTVRGMHANEFGLPIPPMRTHLLKPVGLALQALSTQMQALLDGHRLMSQAVAHEMRTPLARLRFTTQLLQERDENSAEGNELLAELQIDLQWLEDLVSAGVEYVRFGRMPLVERVEVDAPSMLRALLAALQTQYPLQFDLHAPVRLVVQANAAALELALRNLLGNACKYARHRVCITAVTQGDHAVIDIDDDGPGIAPAHREQVFEPYVRLDPARAGFGLGLAMVKAIVERHGGSIEVQLSPAQGARLRMRLPLQVADA